MADGQQCRLVSAQYRDSSVMYGHGWVGDGHCYRRQLCGVRVLFSSQSSGRGVQDRSVERSDGGVAHRSSEPYDPILPDELVAI